MNQPGSALLTAVNAQLNQVDARSLSAALHASLTSLQDIEPSLSEVIAAKLTADGPVLVTGTGNFHFDAQVAAALGIPLIVLIDDPSSTAGSLAQNEADELGAVVAAMVTADQLGGDVAQAIASADASPVMSPALFESWLLERAAEKQAHIVLPEGDDDRILQAADQLLARKVAQLTILGNPEEIASRAQELGLDLEGAQIIDHTTDPRREEFAQDFAELRKAKGITLEQARETMADISYFATMMVHRGECDGMVSGAAHTTAHTIRPAFQIIKTAPEASVVSSIFLMVMQGRLWAFGDCAVNPNPTAEQLGEIAVVSARTAAQFGIDPRVAMLSYSTGSSGAGPDVERCAAAVDHARELDSELKVDGPLQFDAAVDPGVAKKKMPESSVAGQANVFVFPDLEAGNIGYKTAQRTGSALAVGPVLQGLNKPINDLSRGATVPDIVNTVAITAIQAGAR